MKWKSKQSQFSTANSTKKILKILYIIYTIKAVGDKYMIALSNSAVYNQSQGLSVSAQRDREMMVNILEALNQ